MCNDSLLETFEIKHPMSSDYLTIKKGLPQ